MKLVAAIVLAAALATSANAAVIDPTGGGRWAAPPAKYVHPFAGKVVVIKNLTPFALGAFWPVYGYSFVWPSNPPTCVIQVWKKYWSTSLYRHERSHCNGWRWDHPPY